MKIAQVSPLIESVPPQQYGGIERIVSYLTEELVAQGHEVTLFASGDSSTTAKLVTPCKQALRLSGYEESLAYHLLMFEEIYRRAADFDVIHFHTGTIHYPFTRRLNVPHISTHHGRLDTREIELLTREFHEIPVASISNSQRSPIAYANWQGTVYNGLPLDLYRFQAEPKNYLAFLGRISPEKGVDQAIAIARHTGYQLKIAAKVDSVDEAYFSKTIQPLLELPGIEFIGEITDAQKQEFLGNATALLFPINWPEPFGLVMIEAMACGTPVIAYRRGAVPEVMKNNISGFTVNHLYEAINSVEKLSMIDRWKCRRVFEQRFSAQRMTRDYLRIYEQQIQLNPQADVSDEKSIAREHYTKPLIANQQH